MRVLNARRQALWVQCSAKHVDRRLKKFARDTLKQAHGRAIGSN